MTDLITRGAEAPSGTRRPLTVGFHTRIPFATGRVAESVQDGIELFRVGEQLGFDRGWVYQRHFDNYLSSPLVFLPVVAQHTERIGLGTAIIGIRYEDPVLLAEAASLADHLTQGRLQLGFGTGQGGFDAAFGQEVNDGRDQAQDRLAVFLRAIQGQSVGRGTDFGGAPLDRELTVRGLSDTLIERVWFGAGSATSATRIGGQGLRLLLSTILTEPVDDYNEAQRQAIADYRAAHTGPRVPRVSVSRSVLPATTPELARLYAAYDEERRTLGPGASRPQGAVDPRALDGVGDARPRFSVSDAVHGDPSAVLDALLADVALAEADELILFLPPAFGLAENRRLLEDLAEHVIPHLGRPVSISA